MNKQKTRKELERDKNIYLGFFIVFFILFLITLIFLLSSIEKSRIQLSECQEQVPENKTCEIITEIREGTREEGIVGDCYYNGAHINSCRLSICEVIK